MTGTCQVCDEREKKIVRRIVLSDDDNTVIDIVNVCADCWVGNGDYLTFEATNIGLKC